jgi:hypothetical protein
MAGVNDSASRFQGEILLYQVDDQGPRLEVRLQDESVWLSLNQMAELFQVDKSGISRHLKNIFDTGELRREAVVANFATTARDGKAYQVDYFNLDAIISVGYRVNSLRGTQFRIWATQRLREYIVKGFALDDARLKKGGGGNYFDELLARIRDIRSSEKMFWRKVLDIYATSIDYDPRAEASQLFFQTVQNKMHWAAHGHTAAEVIHDRVDAEKPNLGLTSWGGVKPRAADVEIAKNYLAADELEILNRIVTLYLDFAELQALERHPMYMKDWIAKLDDFLRVSGRNVLTHKGLISHEKALAKAKTEFERYRFAHRNDATPVEQHFKDSMKFLENETKAIAKSQPRKTPKKK